MPSTVPRIYLTKGRPARKARQACGILPSFAALSLRLPRPERGNKGKVVLACQYHTAREISSTYEGAARADPSGTRLRERACGSHQV
jgi:hypothetical protein